MGKELEYKLYVLDEDTLLRVLADDEIASLCTGIWQSTHMKTTYFDSDDRRFGLHHWTLRRRMEGEKSVVCLKTPQNEAHTRGEWQIEAESVDEIAIKRLIESGAPKTLLLLYGDGKLHPICGAEFLRRSVMLEFPDGSRAELAGDCGILSGPTQTLSFTELELERYAGAPTAMIALVQTLCARYGLREQPLSKSARARRLK